MKISDLVYLFLFLGFVQDIVETLRLPAPNCPAIILKNGRVKRRQRGRFVKFVCSSGFLLSGERYSTCSQGLWDPSPPKCIRPTCTSKVDSIANGLIYPSHSGAALHFFCKAGYKLKGPTDLYCDGRKWDNNAPSCIANNSKPKLYCDFEEIDLCGWTHDLNHDFDWRRENYRTPSGSIGTGPSFDHTKGPGQDGYYMYIESSSRNENDTARLISPIYDQTDSETCLEFFYHMFGATTGTLRVYLKKVSMNWTLDPSTAIFSKSGNQGDKWYRSYHSLGVIDEEYQIVIEGIRGPGYVSDIAIDDVKITEDCVYEEDTLSTSTEIPSSTEILPTVESCENRCGHKATGNETQLILCDCDELCYFQNKCCPDFLDFCLIGSTTDDYSASTDMPNEINAAEDTTLDVFTTTVIPARLTTKRPASPVFKITKTTTAARTTTKTSSAITRINTTSKPSRSTTRKSRPSPRTIKVLTSPTTPAIVQKVLPTLRPKPKQYKTSKPVKPSYPKESESNDVLDVPQPKYNDDEQLQLNSPPPKDEDTSKEKWSVELESHFNPPYMRNVSESDKLLSQKMPEEAHYNIVLVLISVVGVTVLTVVIAVYVVKRYRCSTRRLNYSNGDSQSEIRFIINDETIDLSLDTGGYDDL